MKKIIILILLFVIITIALLVVLSGDYIRDRKLQKETEKAIALIEEYKSMTGKLPMNLDEVKFNNFPPPDSIMFDIINDTTYTLSFTHSIDYNLFYYSDEKKWYKGVR